MICLLTALVQKKDVAAAQVQDALRKNNVQLEDLVGFKPPGLLPKLLTLLTASSSKASTKQPRNTRPQPTEKVKLRKTILKRLHKERPWCLQTMRSLCQGYAFKMKQETKNQRKWLLKTAECLLGYFEHSYESAGVKEWVYLHKLLQQLILKHKVPFAELLTIGTSAGSDRLHLWTENILGVFLASVHGTHVYSKVVDVVRVAGVHSPEVIG